MAKFHRTSITVPTELRARMDAVKDEANWSRIACQAFEQEVVRIEKLREEKKEASKRDAIANRLQATMKQTVDALLTSRGMSLGQEWASEKATAAELQATYELREKKIQWHNEDMYTWRVSDDPTKGPTLRTILGLTILGIPEERWEKFREDADQIVEAICGTGYRVKILSEMGDELPNWSEHEIARQDEVMIHSFIEGAAAIWGVVKSRISKGPPPDPYAGIVSRLRPHPS